MRSARRSTWMANAYTIIGVLPRAFVFAPGGNAEFWVPLNRFSTHETMRGFYNFWGIGRLRDGVSRAGSASGNDCHREATAESNMA